MKRRATGWLLVATGVVCALLHFAYSLSAASTPSLRSGGLLLLIGLAAFITGIVLVLSGKKKGDS